eukprot:TRINITY_DN93796_c0_g1_i1.p1 TRINITY_DN93796_c0_g1~~TRINITY_DN93796_c0_g1_i1.p1  ORF type:complete len:380 (+),score=42.86 TRINITY_DN93796_c0_g1_i1:85-1224(+)
MAVQLQLDVPIVWAYCSAQVRWVDSSEKWDTISLYKNGQRMTWQWCQNVQCFDIHAEEPGEYMIEYRKEAGYLSSGKVNSTLKCLVESPLLEFSICRRAVAAEEIEVTWRLAAAVGNGYCALLQTSEDDVTIQSLQISQHTDVQTLQGKTCFVAPRVSGEFRACVRGNSSAQSILEERTLQVTVPEDTRRNTFVQLLAEGGPKRAMLTSPRANLNVEWQFPLAAAGDAICIIEGLRTGRLVRNSVCKASTRGAAGQVSLQVPEAPGQYSVCLAAGYRDGQVLLPVAHCHLFVSELLDLAPSAISAGIASESVQAAATPDEASSARPQCIICMSADIDVMVEPCGHAQFCSPCLGRSLGVRRTCPVCRNNVTGQKAIFLP